MRVRLPHVRGVYVGRRCPPEGRLSLLRPSPHSSPLQLSLRTASIANRQFARSFSNTDVQDKPKTMAESKEIRKYLQESHDKIFESNRKWAAEQKEKQPDFFEKLSAGQSPDYLWIGISPLSPLIRPPPLALPYKHQFLSKTIECYNWGCCANNTKGVATLGSPPKPSPVSDPAKCSSTETLPTLSATLISMSCPLSTTPCAT